MSKREPEPQWEDEQLVKNRVGLKLFQTVIFSALFCSNFMDDSG